MNQTLFNAWLSTAREALAHSGYAERLHFASLSNARDTDDWLRIAYKPNVPAPWAIEIHIDPWNGRSPRADDVESIARRIDTEAASRKFS